MCARLAQNPASAAIGSDAQNSWDLSRSSSRWLKSSAAGSSTASTLSFSEAGSRSSSATTVRRVNRDRIRAGSRGGRASPSDRAAADKIVGEGQRELDAELLRDRRAGVVAVPAVSDGDDAEGVSVSGPRQRGRQLRGHRVGAQNPGQLGSAHQQHLIGDRQQRHREGALSAASDIDDHRIAGR